MKLTYLGTAAAEGFPAIFCNCKYCREARALGGKNIRTRSQALVNCDLLIDFPADTYMHFLQNGIEGDAIKYLIVTHEHQDHFYHEDFRMRNSGFANNKREEKLRVFASRRVCKILEGKYDTIDAQVLHKYETVEFGDYRVTPLPAKHMFEIEGGEPFIYIIEGDKTLLYANDTGYFYEDVFAYIEKRGVKFDAVSFDCTNIDIAISDDGGHMGLANIARVIERLCIMGAIDENTVKYVNHFSHNANPLHDTLSKNAEKYGCLVSFDGCVVKF